MTCSCETDLCEHKIRDKLFAVQEGRPLKVGDQTLMLTDLDLPSREIYDEAYRRGAQDAMRTLELVEEGLPPVEKHIGVGFTALGTELHRRLEEIQNLIESQKLVTDLAASLASANHSKVKHLEERLTELEEELREAFSTFSDSIVKSRSLDS